jgi:hypothetical protein
MMLAERLSKAGGVSAILGAVVLTVSTALHPSDAHPNHAPAAFAEYAADRLWIATHLGQLAGVVLIGGGLIVLAWLLRRKRAGIWAGLGAAGVLVSMPVFGVLQAVDGIALKKVVDRWASAPPELQPMVFEAAFAVRQIEIGLASIGILFFALATMLYGMAQLSDANTSNWLGWLGIVSGVGMFTAGIAAAHGGFSDTYMSMLMISNTLLVLWVILVGWGLIRR